MTRDTGARQTIISRQAARFAPTLRRTLGVAGLAAITVAAQAGCTQAQKAGKSPAYLIIDSINAASGAEPDRLAGTLSSDVVTLSKAQINGQEVQLPTIYADPAEVIFRLALKDPGSAESPTTPTSANFITVKRYHVRFIRSDGRNTPGVDVPYPFDGGMTATVTDGGAKAGFTIVRAQAKEEAPLSALAYGGGSIHISTIAEITFYGTDQAGREVSVSGNMSVNFADWGDPQ